jgi:hypothetical protein
VETEVATVAGIGMEGKDSVRRASEPIVDEAESNKLAARTRIDVWRRSGREAGVLGVPRRPP